MATLCRVLFWRRRLKSSRRFIQCCSQRSCSTVAHEEKNQVALSDIIIPAYIPRGPTDILRALAATVRRDPTAAHYVYHDDPFLMPTNSMSKRTFMLSKESGKRAARYFLENFPEHFENDEAEPKIPAFNPPLKVTDLTDVSTESLTDLIHTQQVENALQTYSNIKKAGVKVKHETLCELLELLSYYNGSEPADETYRDEKWFMLYQGNRETKEIWKDEGPAEVLFEEMEVKDARAYRALIQGTALYANPSKCLKLYSEMKEKGFEGTTQMYNCLLNLIPHISPAADVRWAKAEEFLQAMVQEEIDPDVRTFNSLLYLLTRMPGSQTSKNKALSILAEMKVLDIQPSLGTFAHALNVFCRNRGHISYILHDIMNIIESKTWELKDPYDLSFFPTAMAIANKHLHDLDIAHRVFLAVNTSGNRKFLEDAHKESIFYTHYFTLLCTIQEPDKFLQTYEAIVPHQYIPEPHVMQEILVAVQNSGQLKHLPKLWSDILIFQMDNRDSLVRLALSAIAEGGKLNDKILQEQLTEVGSSIFERIKAQSLLVNQRVTISCTGELFGDLLTCFLNGDNFDKSWELINYITKNKNSIIGHPPAKPLLEFCKTALEIGANQKALTCLRYACDAELPEAALFLRANASKLPKDFLNRYTSLERLEEELE